MQRIQNKYRQDGNPCNRTYNLDTVFIFKRIERLDIEAGQRSKRYKNKVSDWLN